MKYSIRYSWLLIVCLCSMMVGMAHDGLRAEQWEIPEFIWNGGIAVKCDVGLKSNPEAFFRQTFFLNEYNNISSGDIIWIRSNHVKRFFAKVFTRLNQPVVLVINGEDTSFPSESGLKPELIDLLLSSQYIVHIFAQNMDYPKPHPKLTHIPIGIDFHTIAYRISGFWGEEGSPLSQEKCLKDTLQTLLPTHMRIKRAFVDFHHNDSMRYGNLRRYVQFGEDRTSIFNWLLTTRLIDYGPKMSRSELWATKGQYAFSVSPPGNGIDCHRTWEDLALGCIVIVKTSPIDPVFDGLPVVIVKDWTEVTAANMDIWLERYGDAFTNLSYREKITHAYWWSKIEAAAAPYR